MGRRAFEFGDHGVGVGFVIETGGRPAPRLRKSGIRKQLFDAFLGIGFEDRNKKVVQHGAALVRRITRMLDG